jgi:hypothetical protein
VSEGTVEARKYRRLRSWTDQWRPTPPYLQALVATALGEPDWQPTCGREPTGSTDKGREPAARVTAGVADLDNGQRGTDTDRDKRRALANALYQLGVRVWQRHAIATARKERWHVGMRIGPAAAAVAAAAAGGTLIGGLTGTLGIVVGAIVVAFAIAGAAGNALQLDEEFVYQADRSRELERIGWDIITTITQDLPDNKGVPGLSTSELRKKVNNYATEIASAINRNVSRSESKAHAATRASSAD